MHVAIFIFLLTVIQQAEGVPLQIGDGSSNEDIDDIFRDKSATEQKWPGEEYVRKLRIIFILCVHKWRKYYGCNFLVLLYSLHVRKY